MRDQTGEKMWGSMSEGTRSWRKVVNGERKRRRLTTLRERSAKESGTTDE